MTAVLSVLLFMAVFAPSAWPGFYRWVDRDGREFYTNDPAKIPSEYRNQVVSVETEESRVSIGEGTPEAAVPVLSIEHKDINGRGEEYWRERARKLRRQLRRLEDEYSVILRQEREQEEKEKAGVLPRKRGTAKINRKKYQLEKKIARLKRELEVELPDEARRAGAYPGWLRE